MNTPTVQSEPASVSTARVADNGGARRVAAQGRAFSPAELAFLEQQAPGGARSESFPLLHP